MLLSQEHLWWVFHIKSGRVVWWFAFIVWMTEALHSLSCHDTRIILNLPFTRAYIFDIGMMLWNTCMRYHLHGYTWMSSIHQHAHITCTSYLYHVLVVGVTLIVNDSCKHRLYVRHACHHQNQSIKYYERHQRLSIVTAYRCVCVLRWDEGAVQGRVTCGTYQSIEGYEFTF
jgi:hypothetical protein